MNIPNQDFIFFIQITYCLSVWSGDSGGPVLYLNQSYSLVGVTSFNWEEEGNFNGFVSVRAALPWIEDTLKEGDDFKCQPVGP